MFNLFQFTQKKGSRTKEWMKIKRMDNEQGGDNGKIEKVVL